MAIDVSVRADSVRADSVGPAASRVVLQASGIKRSFGATKAVQSVDIQLQAGEIHGLIGENGSGKSTTLNILSGQLERDSGTITDDSGRAISQRELRSLVAIVTQELSLAQDLSVGENILMSHEKPRTWRGIDWNELHRRAAIALERVGLDVDSRTPVRRLRIDQQQLVEVAKAIDLNHPVLILDEPTSSLTEDETAVLAQVMRNLSDSGIALVLVSHRLEELLELTDRITVLRDGSTVSCRPTPGLTQSSVIEDMLGHQVETYQNDAVASRGVDSVLALRGFTVPGHVHGIDLNVSAGEIVGLVGLEGAGRSELLEAIFGARAGTTGQMVTSDHRGVPRSPREAIGHGVALVPSDRKNDGLHLDMSIASNLTLPSSCRRNRLRLQDRRSEIESATQVASDVKLQGGSIGRTVRSLSGGNQQKVLLGKWLETKPKLLLLDDPTRGVDVGAKREIHQLVARAARDGVAIVVSSSEIDELLALCDRFVVMFRGQVVAEVPRQIATEASLSHIAAGAGR